MVNKLQVEKMISWYYLQYNKLIAIYFEGSDSKAI